jgi:uncharacterized protein (DUF427 family)
MDLTESRHYVVIDAYDRKLSMKYKGEIIVETRHALILKEVAKTVYNPVLYVPKEDIKVNIDKEPNRNSHCPVKGNATYWNLQENPTEDYFAWSYEEALPRAKRIEGYIAFNPAYITMISEPV